MESAMRWLTHYQTMGLTANHALRRTRPSRPGCNRGVPRAGSLSLGRSATPACLMKIAVLLILITAAAVALVACRRLNLFADAWGDQSLLTSAATFSTSSDGRQFPGAEEPLDGLSGVGDRAEEADLAFLGPGSAIATVIESLWTSRPG